MKKLILTVIMVFSTNALAVCEEGFCYDKKLKIGESYLYTNVGFEYVSSMGYFISSSSMNGGTAAYLCKSLRYAFGRDASVTTITADNSATSLDQIIVADLHSDGSLASLDTAAEYIKYMDVPSVTVIDDLICHLK